MLKRILLLREPLKKLLEEKVISVDNINNKKRMDNDRNFNLLPNNKYSKHMKGEYPTLGCSITFY